MNLGQRVGEYFAVFTFCGLLQALGTNSQTLTQGTGCRESWIRNSNTHATGGTKFAAVNVEDQCFATCITRLDCVAIELNTNVYPAECWIFTDPNPLQASVFQSGYNQYILQTRCPQGQQPVCRDRWELLTASKARGRGTFIQNIDTEDQCLNTCLLNLRCLAVDVKISVSPYECYVQTNQSALTNPLFTEEYSLYILLSRCDNMSSSASTIRGSSSTTLPFTVPDVTQCWTEIQRQFSINGIQQNLPDLQSCRTYCASVARCVAIDFDTSTTPPCWIHTDINDLTPSNTYNDNPFVNQHILDKSGSCTSISSSSSSVGSTVSTASTSQISGSPTVCWNEFPRQYSVNGVPQNFPDVQSCRAYCVGISSCVAVDFDTSATPKCWVHTDINDLTPINTYNDNPSVNQHQINRSGSCTSISTSTSSASSTVSTATTSGISGPPTVCWTEIQRQFSINGIQQNLPDVSRCRDYCASVAGCVGIDFDTSTTPPCWIHTNINDLTPSNTYNDNPFVNQHIINRSGACSLSSTSIGSTLSASSTVSTVSTSATSGPLTVCWNEFPRQYSVNGVPQNFPDVSSCRAYCVGISTCVGVDFDTSATPKCWVHTDINDLTPINTYNDNPFVSQHQINRSGTCTSISTSSSSASSTASTASSTSSNTATATTSRTTPGPSTVCWTEIPRQYSIRGVQQNIPDVLNCRNYCASVATCVAIDFDTSAMPPCWIHTDINDLTPMNTYNDNPFVSQHQINRGGTCTTISTTTLPSSSSTSTGCMIWTPKPNVQSEGAEQADFSLLRDCQNYCIGLPQCVAVDFDTSSDPPCWIHSDLNNLLVVIENTAVIQYLLNRPCIGTVIPGSSTSVPSSQSSTSGPTVSINSDCPRWTRFPDVNSVNGVQYAYNNIYTCLEYCDSVMPCVAIDFDPTTSPPCWIHTNPDDITFNNTYYSPTTTQYRINRQCSGTLGTESPTSPTSATTSSTGTTSGPPCPPRWIRYSDRLSLNAAHYLGINTVDDCLSYCAIVPECVAFDFDGTTTDSAGCWLHMSLTDLFQNNTYSPSYDVSQYIVDRSCPTVTTLAPNCVTQWSFRNNTSSSGGLHYFQYRTIQTCQQLCVSLPVCVAVDFNSDLSMTSGGCYVHTNAGDLDNQYEAEGVLQYRVIGTNCGTFTGPGDCIYLWSQPFYEQNIGGGVPTRDGTFGECQDRCVRVSTCLGIDIDTNPDRYAYCWLTVMPGQLSPYPGVTHYQLTRGPTCPEVNTSPTTTATTVSSTTGVTGIYGVCPYYREMANSNANGGTSRGPMPIDQCLSMCIAQYPYCVAIDYRTADSRCYHQNSLSGRQWNSCCTRYELVCQTSNCTDSFAQFLNLVPSLRGYPQPTITTRAACEAACFANSSCYGYSLARTPRYQGYDCLLSVNTIGSTDFAAEYDLYVRQFCRMTVPPTATVTPPPTPPAGYCLLDIVFVVDNSGSILENQPPGVNNLDFIKMFLHRVIESPVEVGPYFDHVGIVKFESSAFQLYDLCQTQTVDAITVTGINGIPMPMGETNTPAALRMAYNMLFSSSGCGRRYAKPVVVLITDGVTTLDFRSDLKDSIDALKGSGTTNVAVGITDEINMQDLLTFASATDDVGVVTTFQELLYEEARVINRLVGLCGRTSIATITRPSTTQTSATSTSASTATSTSTSTSTTTSTTTRSTTSFQSTPTSSTSSSSTTTTTTTTAPTTSSTTTTTAQPSTSTTTIPPPVARPTAFSAGRSGNLNGPVTPVPLDFVLSNVNGAYNNVSYSYTTPSSGLYFIEICVGLQSGQPAAVALRQGGSTVLGLVWLSRLHNGVDTVCRAGLLQLLPSVTLTLSLEIGATYSSTSMETMFSVFSVSDAMTDDARMRTVVAVGNSSSDQTGILPLTATIGGSSGSFDASTSSYTCTASGLYFFSFTVGTYAMTAARVDLTGLSRVVEVTRNSESLTGVTTLSRTVLLPCPEQSKVRLNITFGSITNYAAYQMISFSAFPYRPRYVTAAAWSLLKDYNSDTQSGPMDPFYFNIIAYNDDGLYDSNSRQVTIRTSGFYYVYISTGSATFRPLTFSLRRNGVTLFAINHQTRSTDAEDSGGHGAVVALYANDVLKVVGEVESYTYSSDLGHQISFFGMIIYGL